MRCLACNGVLNDRESTRREITTKEFVDLCDSCFEIVMDIVYDNRIDCIEQILDEED